MSVPPMNVKETIAAQEEGRDLSFRFFWGHKPSPEGIGPGCLSNWWEAPFDLEGRTWPTVEHYMMVHKARTFGDEEMGQRILAARHPGDAKKLGRKVRDFDATVWSQVCVAKVLPGIKAKFNQNAELRVYLMSTHPEILVEASPYDRIWGIGMDRSDPRVENPRSWRGMNLLGFSLMFVRQTLIEESQNLR